MREYPRSPAGGAGGEAFAAIVVDWARRAGARRIHHHASALVGGAEGRAYLREAWWVSTLPGVAIFLTVMGFNLFGDGLRDAFDPRLR